MRTHTQQMRSLASSQRALKISILAAFVRVIVAFIAVFPFAAPAQQAGTTSPAPPNSAAITGPTRFGASAQTRSQLPEPPNTSHALMGQSPKKNLRAAGMVPGTPLFVSAAAYGSGGFSPLSVAVGDVNGDGIPDLLVVNFSSNNVGVLLGNGDGTFQHAITFATGGVGAVSVAVSDVNRDGNLDLIVANTCDNDCSGSGQSGVGVLLGNGDGTFRAAVTYPSGGSFIQSVSVADVNGDGIPDLLVLNSCPFRLASKCGIQQNGTVGVLLGGGAGDFQPVAVTDSGGLEPTSFAVADINGDGNPDVVVANSLSGTVGVLLGRGARTFKRAITYPAFGASWVAIADLNGDGKLDLAVANGSAAGVLLGSGDGSFEPMISYNSGGQDAFSIAVSDVNGDGKADLLVANAGSGTLGVLLGNGDGTFHAPLTYNSGGSSPVSVAVADVNGDGTQDVVLANADSNTVGVLLNNTGVHSPTSTALTSSLNPSTYGQKVTWTSTVTTSGSVRPTGKVRFTWSDFTIGSATLSNGVATLTKSNLNADSYPLTAIYGGDADNLPSTSAILNQLVLQTTSSATLTSSPNPSTQGQAVTFTAKISSPTVIPTGPVTFTSGKTVLGTAQLSGGKAILMISSLPVGSTKVTVTFNGDSNIAKSSASVIQTVQ